MPGLRRIALIAASLAVLTAAAGFVPQSSHVDDCCQEQARGLDDCCESACDNCLRCAPTIVFMLASDSSVSLSEPPDRLELPLFRDPLAPEPRGILHVPKTA